MIPAFNCSDADTVYNEAKSVRIPVSSKDAEYQTYVVDMSGSPRWSNSRVRQILIDPIDGSSLGQVSIDSIRIVP
ncbi:hypothetical protein [Paenibacillus sp. HJGM_3]|uniref:hypothetical protein n=1 Tax=Paenibacillus sp. HJGM_3 TaxID=3379816 RepID=UPI00385B3A98